MISHDANEIRSTPVPAAANIRILADDCDVVGIDEAQFFDDEIVSVCNDLANKGIRVIVAGLDMDYKGNPFGPMPNLMATSEYVTKVHAVCTHTGNLAQYSFRFKVGSMWFEGFYNVARNIDGVHFVVES